MPSRPWIVAVALAGLAGFILLALPGSGAQQTVGTVLLAGMLIAVIAVVVARLGPQSQPDREREELARQEFDRTGSWPAD
jgi:drug/metabolite transporter (DMT)-like permease